MSPQPNPLTAFFVQGLGTYKYTNFSVGFQQALTSGAMRGIFGLLIAPPLFTYGDSGRTIMVLSYSLNTALAK